MDEENINFNDLDSAEAWIEAKIAQALPCPFCGKRAKIKTLVQEDVHPGGANMYFMGYYIKQEGCCSLFPTGREDCFYINKSQDSNFRKLRLNEWAKMCKIFVEEWNQRSK